MINLSTKTNAKNVEVCHDHPLPPVSNTHAFAASVVALILLATMRLLFRRLGEDQ